MSAADTTKTLAEETLAELTSAQIEHLSIQHRLALILSELPSIGKDARNTQQNFDYRSHDSVLNALNPLLSRYGVFVTPRVIERVPEIRSTKSNSTMYEVNLHVEFTFWATDGTCVHASAWGEGTDLGDKATNKAMTGAFKNVLAQVFAIATGEPDGDGGTPEPTTRGGQAPATAPASRARQSSGGQRAPFNPATDLLEGAIHGEDAPSRIGEALASIDPTTDWRATMAPAYQTVFGVGASGDIEAARMPEFWRRMSNMVRKIDTQFPDGSVPPTEPVIQDAAAFAFEGALITLIPDASIQAAEEALAAEAARAAGDDIPFGEPVAPGDDIPLGEPADDEPREHKDPTS